MTEFWKSCFLSAYRQGSLPWRRWSLRRLAQQGNVPVCVLFYHRVADSPSNPWTISRSGFLNHIEWLQANCDMVSLSRAQQLCREGNYGRIAVTITFDDGYAENCDFALPLLKERAIPCTYFVCLDNIRRGIPFPHDVQLEQYLRPNTPQQICDIARAGFDIGAHTRRHANLGKVHDPERLRDEVVVSRDDLQQLISEPVNYFAFPYGVPEAMSTQAFRLARSAGYRGVCSAYGGYNFRNDDPFHIQRIHGDPDISRLKNWLTFDPRKPHNAESKYFRTMEAQIKSHRLPIA
jgi:peptidoglycan/xylan/chitin deacetylase (PgdA/CDA1 family)